MKTLTTILTLLLATPALAIDPECIDAIGEPTVYNGCQLKTDALTATLRFCSPQFDIDGDSVPVVGAVGTCTVELDSLAVTVPVTAPGILFESTITGKYPGHTIRAWCSTVEGLTGLIWSSDLCFPSQKLKKPHKK